MLKSARKVGIKLTTLLVGAATLVAVAAGCRPVTSTATLADKGKSKSANVKWVITGANWSGSIAIGKDGALYVAAQVGNDPQSSRLYAINPNGSQRWSFTINNKNVMGSPAVGDDGTVYVGVGSSTGPGDSLYAINPNGTKKWELKVAGIVYAAPSIGEDGTIYCGTAGYKKNRVYAVNPNGAIKWEHETAEEILWAAVGKKGTVYFGGQTETTNVILAIDKHDGKRAWKMEANIGRAIAGFSSPVIGADGTLYFESSRMFHLLSLDGKRKETFAYQSSFSSTPVIGKDGTIYAGGDSLYAFDGEGNKKWAFKPQRPESALYPFTGADGTIYFFGIEEGENPQPGSTLYALDSSGREKWELAGVDHQEDVAVPPVTGSDGTIYFATQQGKLFAISAKN